MNTESNRIEYKLKLTDNLEREVVAFLNYHEGGQIFIGIDDVGTVVGVKNTDGDQLKIIDRIKNNIAPSTLGLFDVVVEKKNGKNTINIIISSGSEKPYYIKNKGMSEAGCFIRVGSSVQSMSQEMIDTLYVKRNRQTLSTMMSPRSKLSFEQLKIYYEEKGLKLNDQFRENLDLLTEDGKYNYAAYMLADNNGISIKIAKYAGKNKVDLIENEEYGYCSIIKATKNALDRLNVENKTFAKITSTTRLQKNMVDKVALREAVINAIVHNDYSREVPPVFEIFSDRITVTSYGGLVSGLSTEDFFNCRSMPRNRELMRVFKDVGLVEHLGSGMNRILEVYDKSIFEFSPNFLIVTFPFDEGFENNTTSDGALNGVLNSGKKIMEIIRENNKVTKRELAQVIGMSERTIDRYIAALQADGIIKRAGSKKTGYWEILKKD